MRRASMVGFLALLVVTLAAAPADSLVFKCGKARGVLVAIDGEFTDSEIPDIDLSDVYALKILCWLPADNTFNEWIGTPVIYIVTKGMIESLVSDLELVADAQDAFFAKHSVFGDKLDLLDLGAFATDRVAIELSATSRGWTATAGRDLLLHRCYLFSGGIAAPHSELDEGVPGCFFDLDPYRTLPFG